MTSGPRAIASQRATSSVDIGCSGRGVVADNHAERGVPTPSLEPAIFGRFGLCPAGSTLRASPPEGGSRRQRVGRGGDAAHGVLRWPWSTWSCETWEGRRPMIAKVANGLHLEPDAQAGG